MAGGWEQGRVGAVDVEREFAELDPRVQPRASGHSGLTLPERCSVPSCPLWRSFPGSVACVPCLTAVASATGSSAPWASVAVLSEVGLSLYSPKPTGLSATSPSGVGCDLLIYSLRCQSKSLRQQPADGSRAPSQPGAD